MEHTEATAIIVEKNLEKIKEQFNWPVIVNEYEAMIIDCYNKSVK